jgi:hypothetical protein
LSCVGNLVGVKWTVEAMAVELVTELPYRRVHWPWLNVSIGCCPLLPETKSSPAPTPSGPPWRLLPPPAKTSCGRSTKRASCGRSKSASCGRSKRAPKRSCWVSWDSKRSSWVSWDSKACWRFKICVRQDVNRTSLNRLKTSDQFWVIFARKVQSSFYAIFLKAHFHEAGNTRLFFILVCFIFLSFVFLYDVDPVVSTIDLDGHPNLGT